MEGIGEANTPAFRVDRRPALVDYSYEGAGGFRIDLIDRESGRFVERLVSTVGAVQSSTYINRSGVFYLKISGDAAERRNSAATPQWSLSVDANR